jgi:hypothetical protein
MRAAPLLTGPAPIYHGDEPAMVAAREIIRRSRRFINFRSAIPLGTWEVNPLFRWRVSPSEVCMAGLRAQGIAVEPLPEVVPARVASTEVPPEATVRPRFPTPTPVLLRGPIEGVTYRSARKNGVVVSCALAQRMVHLSKVVARHGVVQVNINSAYRRRPNTSFHTMGMALDIFRFMLRERVAAPDGSRSRWLSVARDFYVTPNHRTCDPKLFGPSTPVGANERSRRLLAIACALFETGQFSSVLTPNYNAGHRDHFHVDIRPDDPRIYIR